MQLIGHRKWITQWCITAQSTLGESVFLMKDVNNALSCWTTLTSVTYVVCLSIVIFQHTKESYSRMCYWSTGYIYSVMLSFTLAPKWTLSPCQWESLYTDVIWQELDINSLHPVIFVFNFGSENMIQRNLFLLFPLGSAAEKPTYCCKGNFVLHS